MYIHTYIGFTMYIHTYLHTYIHTILWSICFLTNFKESLVQSQLTPNTSGFNWWIDRGSVFHLHVHFQYSPGRDKTLAPGTSRTPSSSIVTFFHTQKSTYNSAYTVECFHYYICTVRTYVCHTTTPCVLNTYVYVYMYIYGARVCTYSNNTPTYHTYVGTFVHTYKSST